MKEISLHSLCRFILAKYKFSFLSDDLYIKWLYRLRFREKLDLKHPISFNAKLQWLKLNDRNPKYSQFVDKYAVREYIEKKIGKQYLIPLLGIWNTLEEVDVTSLPDQFVIKSTHDSGSYVVCHFKEEWDETAKKKICKSLKRNYYWYGREWPYKSVPHRIIAERFLQSNTNDLPDYKLMCFNGSVKCILVCTDRFNGKGLKKTFFSPSWERLPFKRPGPTALEDIPAPSNLNTMIALAEQLAVGIPFIRVDFYDVDGKIYFGELTLYPSTGAEAFSPPEWDYILGEWLTLPNVHQTAAI